MSIIWTCIVALVSNFSLFFFLFWGKNCSSQFFFVGVFCAKSICELATISQLMISHLQLDVLLVAKEILNRHWSIPSPQPPACLLSSPLCSCAVHTALGCCASCGKKAMLCVRAPNNTLLLLTLVGCRVSLREGVGKLPGKITTLIRLHLHIQKFGGV